MNVVMLFYMQLLSAAIIICLRISWPDLIIVIAKGENKVAPGRFYK